MDTPRQRGAAYIVRHCSKGGGLAAPPRRLRWKALRQLHGQLPDPPQHFLQDEKRYDSYCAAAQVANCWRCAGVTDQFLRLSHGSPVAQVAAWKREREVKGVVAPMVGGRPAVGAAAQAALEGFVVSRYLDRPLLLGGRKFDLRIYALVMSFQPLRAYLHR